jgi:hypothetical protein
MAKHYRTGGRSTAFTPPDGTGTQYLLDRIPRDLWRRFRARCRERKVSVRARLLTLITRDLEGGGHADQ